MKSVEVWEKAAKKLGVEPEEIANVHNSMTFRLDGPRPQAAGDECSAKSITVVASGRRDQDVDAILSALIQSLAEYENRPAMQPLVRVAGAPPEGLTLDVLAGPYVPYDVATGDKARYVRYIVY